MEDKDTPPQNAEQNRLPFQRKRRHALYLILINVAVISVLFFVFILFLPIKANFNPLRKEALSADEDELLHRFKPNLRDEPYLHGTSPTGESYEYILVSTNAEGFRDYDHAVEKPRKSVRVACVGDSFMFGMDIQQKDTIPTLLEKALNEQTDANAVHFEVFNFGLPGLNFEGMGRVTQTFAMKYQPDVVVYSYISDDISRYDVISVRQWENALRSRLRWTPHWFRSFFFSRFLPRYKMWRYSLDFMLFSSLPTLYKKRLRIILDYHRELAEEGGFRVMIINFYDNPILSKTVAEYNQNLEEPFIMLDNLNVELNPRNQHPTPTSNRRLAPALAKRVKALVSPPQIETALD
jgi:hypothetical protein